MAERDDEDELARWARIMNRRNGHAGIFAQETPEDRTIFELSTVEEWCQSVRAEFGVEIGEASPNPEDPPDCFVQIGRRLDVEVTELVDGPTLARVKRGRESLGRRTVPRHAVVARTLPVYPFGDGDEEGQPVPARGVRVDVLLVCTAEPWLLPADVRDWLASATVPAHPAIAAAFLLMEHEPGYAKHCLCSGCTAISRSDDAGPQEP